MTLWYRYHPGVEFALIGSAGMLTRQEWTDSVVGMLARAPAHGIRRILSDRRGMVGPYPPWMGEVVAEFFQGHRTDLGPSGGPCSCHRTWRTRLTGSTAQSREPGSG